MCAVGRMYHWYYLLNEMSGTRVMAKLILEKVGKSLDKVRYQVQNYSINNISHTHRTDRSTEGLMYTECGL